MADICEGTWNRFAYHLPSAQKFPNNFHFLQTLQLKLNWFLAGFCDFVIYFILETCWTLETLKTLGTSKHWKHSKHWEHPNMGGGHQSRQQPERATSHANNLAGLRISIYLYICVCIYLSIVFCWKTEIGRMQKRHACFFQSSTLTQKLKIHENTFR